MVIDTEQMKELVTEYYNNQTQLVWEAKNIAENWKRIYAERYQNQKINLLKKIGEFEDLVLKEWKIVSDAVNQ